jgi:hypothetical protein
MTQAGWTTIAGAKAALEKKWKKGIYLSEAIDPEGLFPLRVPLSGPSASSLSTRFADAQAWVREFEAAHKSGLLNIEWKEANNRIIGQNRIPAALVFANPARLARFTGKTKELSAFTEVAGFILASFPALKPWLLKNAFHAIELKPVIDRLASVTAWIVEHPRPGIYLRQLCIRNVHTKLIEAHKKTIADWLDLLLDPHLISRDFKGIKGFEERFGFLAKPALVRFRFLDTKAAVGSFSDLTVRADEFSRIPQNAGIVFVTENDINGLSFPQVTNGIVIFGRGYGFDSLRDATWLLDREIRYWGDIDTHGFAILSQFREYFPHTKSFLMDKDILLACKDSWSAEPEQNTSTPANLTKEELALYHDLLGHTYGESIRLEQELIPFEIVNNALKESGLSCDSAFACG